MTPYALYLESGPKRKTTMVHVPDLLGCVATGPTTDEALARTPDAIRAFLRFLRRHGADVDPDAVIETRVAEHITEGMWLGNGSPSIVIAPDLEPLTRAETEDHLARLAWLRQDMLALIAGLSDEEWDAQPASGRPVRRIVEHVAGAEYSYVRLFGKLPGVSGPGTMEKMGRDELLAWTDHLRHCEFACLRSLTDAERAEIDRRGQSVRTARKVVRRMLEHQWEHLRELQERLTPLGEE